MAVFDADPRVIDIALGYFHWVGFSYISLGVGIVLGAAIQGAGGDYFRPSCSVAVVVLFQIGEPCQAGFTEGVTDTSTSGSSSPAPTSRWPALRRGLPARPLS